MPTRAASLAPFVPQIAMRCRFPIMESVRPKRSLSDILQSQTVYPGGVSMEEDGGGRGARSPLRPGTRLTGPVCHISTQTQHMRDQHQHTVDASDHRQ